MTVKEFFNRSFRDKQGHLVLAQAPNVSGGITIGFIILALLFSVGLLHNLLRIGAAVFGMYWAYQEMRYGVNYFRRILGFIVAVMIIARIIKA